MRANGHNRVAAQLAKDTRGGVVLPVPMTVDLNQALAELITSAERMAAWINIGDISDAVRARCSDPPTERQQITLNLLAAMTTCQMAVRAAVQANAEAISKPTSAPKVDPGDG